MKKISVITLIDNNGTELPPNKLPDYANGYFTSLGPNLAGCIKLDNTSYVNSFWSKASSVMKPKFELVTRIELHDLITKIHTSKSSNIKHINSKLFKCCLLFTITHLLYLFNLTITTCKIPDDRKIASVTPIFKPRNKHRISNYRLISLLRLIGKLFEKWFTIASLTF